jgi:DNA phosphorothioation-associated putative methyltransferase
MLEPFMAIIADLGRLPEAEEFPGAYQLIERFGSLKRAFALVRRVTGPAEWDAIRQRRTEDLLVYLALARFRKLPALSQLPRTLQRDIRAFFGTYTKACRQADELLFRAGDASAIDEACQRSTVGKLLPDDLYVHRSALEMLEPLLRVYEGCGRAFLGDIEGANIIKIHRRSGKISYLVYPEFENDPHPALSRCIRLSLRTRELNCYDYAGSANPPILHRKETFLHPTHPLQAKFARLTRQEEQHGLLMVANAIGTRDGWKTRLEEEGLILRGHRLVRSRGKLDDWMKSPNLEERHRWRSGKGRKTMFGLGGAMGVAKSPKRSLLSPAGGCRLTKSSRNRANRKIERGEVAIPVSGR